MLTAVNQEVTIIVKPFRQEKVFHYGVNCRREFSGSGVKGSPSYAAVQTKEHVAAVDARAVGIVAAGKAEEGRWQVVELAVGGRAGYTAEAWEPELYNVINIREKWNAERKKTANCLVFPQIRRIFAANESGILIDRIHYTLKITKE